MSLHFLMSSERSGSNFITKLLNGHPQMCGPSTKHLINPVVRNLFRYGDLRDQENWSTLLDDIHRLISLPFTKWKKNFGREELDKMASRGDVATLIRNVFLAEAEANGKKYVFVKENHIYEFLPFLLNYFSDAKYVYLVRDPRDMALSWKKNSEHPGGVVHAAEQWQKDQANNMKNYWFLKQQGLAYLLRYEDLIGNAGKYSREICAFFDLAYSDEMLRFNEDELTRENSQLQSAWNNLSKGVLSENKEKFLTELSSDEIAMIEFVCRHEMACLGYEPVSDESNISGICTELLAIEKSREMEEIGRFPSERVAENMEAKRAFYQRGVLLDELRQR